MWSELLRTWICLFKSPLHTKAEQNKTSWSALAVLAPVRRAQPLVLFLWDSESRLIRKLLPFEWASFCPHRQSWKQERREKQVKPSFKDTNPLNSSSEFRNIFLSERGQNLKCSSENVQERGLKLSQQETNGKKTVKTSWTSGDLLIQSTWTDCSLDTWTRNWTLKQTSLFSKQFKPFGFDWM